VNHLEWIRKTNRRVEAAPRKPEDRISSRAFDARIVCVSQIQMFHIWLPSSSPLRGKAIDLTRESCSLAQRRKAAKENAK